MNRLAPGTRPADENLDILLWNRFGCAEKRSLIINHRCVIQLDRCERGIFHTRCRARDAMTAHETSLLLAHRSGKFLAEPIARYGNAARVSRQSLNQQPQTRGIVGAI